LRDPSFNQKRLCCIDLPFLLTLARIQLDQSSFNPIICRLIVDIGMSGKPRDYMSRLYRPSSTIVRAARDGDSRQAPASVLQEGRKNANLHAKPGVIWVIPV
jgi:hypothetical protein